MIDYYLTPGQLAQLNALRNKNSNGTITEQEKERMMTLIEEGRFLERRSHYSGHNDPRSSNYKGKNIHGFYD